MTARKVSMRRGLRVTGLALLAAATLEPSATAEEKFQKLTAGQIRDKLAGMELTDNVHWRDLYQRNGTVMSTSMGHRRTGKWRVVARTAMLRRVAIGKGGRAATRRIVAVAGHSR